MKRKTFLIAEIGQAHDGSLGILHSYIDAIADTGVDAVKFQTHIAEAESSEFEPFRINFTYEDASRFDYWRRMSFTKAQWIGIKAHCRERGLAFLSSPFSLAAVDLLEEIGIEQYKVGSGEVSNLLMLEKIARTGKPIILSSGMSSFTELERAVEYIQPFGNEIAILQCTTMYPTPAGHIGFNVIAELKARFPGKKIGLSEHTGKIYTGLAAVALGAEVLEFHAVFDRRMFGPDASSSLSIDEIKTLAEGVRFLETALGNPVDKNRDAAFSDVKKIFGKALAVNKDLPSGHVIQFDDLEAKKPADRGIPAAEFKEIIGAVLNKDKLEFEFLKREDLR